MNIEGNMETPTSPGNNGGETPTEASGGLRKANDQQLGPESSDRIGRLAGVLEKTKVFGRSVINFLTADSTRTRVAEFVAGAAASAATKNIVRELLINTLGGATTGFVGRVAIGGAAGAIVGAGKEYVKQVRGNFKNFAEFEAERRRVLSDTATAVDQDRINELNAQKKHFLEKFKPTDLRAIGKAAIRGTVFGAAGALVASVALDMWEAGQVSKALGDAAGGIGHAIGETAEAAGQTIGDTAGDIGHGVGEAAGAAGRTAENVISNVRDVAGNPNLQYPEFAGVPPPDLTAVAGGAGQAVHEAIGDDSALAITAREAKEQALGVLTSNYEFLQSTAAAVGEQIDQSNLAVDEAIRAAGMNPSQLSAKAYENIRMSIQHRMEGLANEAFNHAAGSADNLDPSHLAEIAKQGHDNFITSLNDPDIKQDLIKSASKALTEHLTAQQEIAENLNQVLSSTPDLATGVITAHGDTVGQLLVDRGYDFTSWGADKAEVLGAHIAANYNQLTNMWGAMEQVHNLPPGIHFPVSLTELSDLIQRAHDGDAEALQKLKDALHWIPAGKKFIILDKAGGVTKVMEALRK